MPVTANDQCRAAVIVDVESEPAEVPGCSGTPSGVRLEVMNVALVYPLDVMNRVASLGVGSEARLQNRVVLAHAGSVPDC
jgi:hypothetical protein